MRTYIHLTAFLFVVVGCGRVDRPSGNLMDSLGELEVHGTLRALSYNVGLSHAGPVYFVNCSRERIRELPQALSEWALLYPQFPFAILLQEANNKNLHKELKRHAEERGWTVVPRDFSDLNSHGLMMVTNEDVLASEFVPFARDRDGYQRGIFRVQLLADDNVLDIFNTQTTSSNAGQLDDFHAGQLNTLIRALEATPVRGKAILAGDLSFGPFKPLSEDTGVSASPFLNWLVGRMPAWWHWSFPDDADYENFMTWDPEINSLARHRTNAAGLWRRMRHRAGWTETAAHRTHFFHSHSVAFESLGLQTFPLYNTAACGLPLPFEGDEELEDSPHNQHYLSDYMALEAIFNFR